MGYTTDDFYQIFSGNGEIALWAIIALAALWGCLLGATGVLAVQEHISGHRKRKDQTG